jgi:2-phospho-L-lactate guanylyltransferase
MWDGVVPVKEWDAAKTRLDLPVQSRLAMVRAMAADTIAAVANCEVVADLTVLVGAASMAGSPEFASATRVLVQPDDIADLDAALSWALTQLPPSTTLTGLMVADLPALTPSVLARALTAAAGQRPHSSAMVADRHGTGTTLLTATTPTSLTPCFGVASARRHRDRGVVPLSPFDTDGSLRCDVDTIDDLGVARSLGLGPNTQRVDASLGSPT